MTSADSQRADPQRLLLYFGGGAALIALLLLAVAAYLFLQGRRFQAEAVRTRGVVTGLVWSVQPTFDRSSRSASPVVEYRAEGRNYTMKGLTASAPPSYHVGDQVTVGYPPGRPAEGRIVSFGEIFLLPLVFFGVGLAFAITAAVLLVLSGRR